MRTTRSLTVSHRKNHARPPPPEQPRMPPQSNHTCLPPRSNHTCPPWATTHAAPLEQPCTPSPEQPRMPPLRATMHAPPVDRQTPVKTLPSQTSFAGGNKYDVISNNGQTYCRFLPTAREGNVFIGVCHSVHNRPHGYSVTANPCYNAVGTHPTGMISCSKIFPREKLKPASLRIEKSAEAAVRSWCRWIDTEWLTDTAPRNNQ